jgi:HD-GYP domain-containing protein (c-di-GMP phosphodiesterase class II)
MTDLAYHLPGFGEDNPAKAILEISRELNGERDIPKLLDLILRKARQITQADAGSIYTKDSHKPLLHFRLTQNDSMPQNLSQFSLPIDNGSVVGHAAITQKTIHIPDLRLLKTEEHREFYGIKHDSTWDARTGYESRSMLTVPIFDISHKVIGVIQLINCKKDPHRVLQQSSDFDSEVIPFHEKSMEYSEILAHQAGIALENANLQSEIESLFHSFVNASVSAIEIRDPTTSGHSHRVAKLTLSLAETVNQIDRGIYQKVYFDRDALKEIEYASLLHDFGKLGVREEVLVKAKKLYPLELQLVQERFENIRFSAQVEYLKKKIKDGPSKNLDRIYKNKLEKIQSYYDFILKANEPTVLEEGDFHLLKDIAQEIFLNHAGAHRSFLSERESKALSVRKGSLTPDEFSEIQSHVSLTYEFLKQIPWGTRLAGVPVIAGKHHEKLDRSGYPSGLGADDIPLQSRMMTIADMYDALTASDRPYKKAMSVERALSILEMDVASGKLDADLYVLFRDRKVYLSLEGFLKNP